MRGREGGEGREAAGKPGELELRGFPRFILLTFLTLLPVLPFPAVLPFPTLLAYLISTAILSAGVSAAFCSVCVAAPAILTSSAFAPV